MFNLSVIDTDVFLEMPISSRLLYYELGMRADDDGFVGGWKKILKMTGLTEDDMKVLIAKDFVIPFESGVIVIKHWRLNNYLRNDRHHETIYQKELSQLHIDNDVYELESTEKSTMLPVGRQVVYLDKNSIDKISIDKGSKEGEEQSSPKRTFTPPTLEEVEKYIEEKNLAVDAKSFIDYFEAGAWTDSRGKKVKNWKQKLQTWNRYAIPKQKNYEFKIE